MAAGLGFKDFTTGEVLTAADVDGYLMQGIWVFASAAARDAAVTSPQEGNACYLKDTDVIQVYTGSAWAAQSASNPISANIVDAKGDLIVGTAADTVSRLAVGTNGYTLVADSSTATGLKWAAASSSALTLIKRASFTSVANTGTTFDDVFTSTYTSYIVNLENIFAATPGDDLQIQARYTGPTTQAATYYGYSTGVDANGSAQNTASSNATQIALSDFNGSSATTPISGQLFFRNVGDGSQSFGFVGQLVSVYAGVGYTVFGMNTTAQNAYMGFLLKSASSNITGTVSIYGLATA